MTNMELNNLVLDMRFLIDMVSSRMEGAVTADLIGNLQKLIAHLEHIGFNSPHGIKQPDHLIDGLGRLVRSTLRQLDGGGVVNLTDLNVDLIKLNKLFLHRHLGLHKG